MPEQSILLRLRSITVRVRYQLDFCGPDCLLQNHPQFLAALPAGMGAADNGGLSSRNLLFETARGTLIKHRKHQTSAHSDFFGVPFRFDRESQDRAFAVLRDLQPIWVSKPVAGCECSYEVTHHPGKIAYPPLSPHANQLSQKYMTRRIENASESTAFLRSAWKILTGLHAVGIRHGDPSFYNFIQTQEDFTDTDLVLIDLDDLMMTPDPGDDWDFSVFFHNTFLPFTASSLTVPEMSTFGRELFAGSRYAPLFSNGNMDSFLQIGFTTAMSGMEATQALRTLEIGDHAVRIFQEESSRTRLLELQAKQAEIDHLTQIAAERLASMNVLTTQIGQKEEEIKALAQAAAERLQSLEAADREMRVQAEAASQRLEVLEGLHRTLHDLQQKQNSSWWPSRG